MKRFSAMTYAKAAWIFCIAAALVVELASPPSVSWCPVGEPRFYAMVALIALTFPACFAVWWPLYALDIDNSPFVLFLTLVAAWMQWFIALPWLWGKWKARKAQRAEAQP